MADFTIDELQILQEHKQSWKKAKGKHNKSQVYKELIRAAYKLPETKALNKQTWTQQKKVSEGLGFHLLLIIIVEVPGVAPQICQGKEGESLAKIW